MHHACIAGLVLAFVGGAAVGYYYVARAERAILAEYGKLKAMTRHL